MRPRAYFAVYNYGRITGVFHGHEAARAACNGRRHYFAFKTQLEAEEFSSWHNYDRDQFEELADRARRERIALSMSEARSKNLRFLSTKV